MRRTVFRFGILSSVFLWLALGTAAAQNQQPMSAAPSVPFAGAIISDWKGNIRINLPGQSPSSPVRGEVLPPGTLLETGNGRLLLRLSDGSQVLVLGHTRLQVQQPAPADRSYFHLLLGRIRAFINKQTGGAPPFELGTPSAVVAVRGTQFDAEVNQRHVTEVDVFEGLVEVYGLGAPGVSVLVEPGFSTRVGIDAPPEQPRPTDEMRPDIERPEREIDSADSREDELELAFETSEMEEVSQEPEVEVQKGPGPL